MAESNPCVSDSEKDLFYPTLLEVDLYNFLFFEAQNRLSTVLASVEAKDPLLGLDTILTKCYVVKIISTQHDSIL